VEIIVILPTTFLLGGLLSHLMLALSLQVSLKRVQLGGISYGDGGNETLRRRIRAHGNFIEYAPLALILVGLIEYGGSERLAAGLAASFFLSRVLHAIGMLYTSTPTVRAVGMLVQHATFLGAGLWLVYRAVA
jgi:uncharacterized membrane protein YecN with MAPEG domain